MTLRLFLKSVLPERRNQRRRRNVRPVAGEVLELRQLLAVTGLTTQVDGNAGRVQLNWQDADHTEVSRYEIWLDQNISDSARNPKVYYASIETAGHGMLNHIVPQRLAPGDYTVYVRGQHGSTFTTWARHSFQIDDDHNPETPVIPGVPQRPVITVIREGQGAAGQAVSEGAIRWMGDAALYDVWLGQRDSRGRLSAVGVVRNVPQQSITLRELALAATQKEVVWYGDLVPDQSVAQLPTGDYEFFVRGVNGAANEVGRWIGQGPWSSAAKVTFHRVEGSAAVPAQLAATDSIRPTVTWQPVAHAEAYLVSIWKGPDYQLHTPTTIRVYGTTLRLQSADPGDSEEQSEIRPGDEYFIRVRAVGSEGALEGFHPGNYASTVIRVPEQLTPADLTAPPISGPGRTITDSMPVLRWQHTDHAASYDVWFTSLQTGRRLFLASDIRDDVLRLAPEVLNAVSDLNSNGQPGYSDDYGLRDGRYRFWIRARNPASPEPGPWSRSYDFTVDKTHAVTRSVSDTGDPARRPLVSPNLVKTWTANGQPTLLVTNGLGESFGASVLGRFVMGADEQPTRPVVTSPATGLTELQFPDLAVGSNVSDMDFLDSHRLAVLSRGSNQLHLIDLDRWEMTSTIDLSIGANTNAPDAMDMEILSNGQILVVFNRSNRLRVFDINDDGMLFEVRIPGTSPADQGFVLDQGRAMQVSAVERSDGSYTLFLATPAVAGTVLRTYTPEHLTLGTVMDNSGQAVETISRSPFSGPYVGGKIQTVVSLSGQRQTFYLSTDRNGFLTWVNVNSFTFGHIDLVEYMTTASRDPASASYRNPDDNHVDPTRIISIDDRHVAVLNNREQSVLLKLTLSSGDGMSVTGAGMLPAGYGGDTIRTPTGLKLVSSSGGSIGISVGSHLLITTDLQYAPGTGNWQPGQFTPTVLATPIDRAVVISDDRLLLEYPQGRRSIVHYHAPTHSLEETYLPGQFEHTDGNIYAVNGGPAAAWGNTSSGRQYIAVRGILSAVGNPTDVFVLVLDVTAPAAVTLHSVHRLDAQAQWYSVQMNGEQIDVLDRLGARLLSVHHWLTGNQTEFRSLEFADRQGRSFGGSRPGRTVLMPDGTRVVLHDTTPDKVFSVLTPESLRAQTPLAKVHTHNVGQWIYDMQIYDQDRVIAVTWDAVLVILNIRTGVFETVQKLDRFSTLPLDVYGVRGISFEGHTLSIGSPAAGQVAEYRVTPDVRGAGHQIELLRVVEAPDVVTTLLTPSALWVLETGRVTRLPR
ncbi:MAG: hypothetical protein RIK87_13185 [Fuerstiella sp.]